MFPWRWSNGTIHMLFLNQGCSLSETRLLLRLCYVLTTFAMLKCTHGTDTDTQNVKATNYTKESMYIIFLLASHWLSVLHCVVLTDKMLVIKLNKKHFSGNCRGFYIVPSYKVLCIISNIMHCSHSSKTGSVTQISSNQLISNRIKLENQTGILRIEIKPVQANSGGIQPWAVLSFAVRSHGSVVECRQFNQLVAPCIFNL